MIKRHANPQQQVHSKPRMIELAPKAFLVYIVPFDSLVVVAVVVLALELLLGCSSVSVSAKPVMVYRGDRPWYLAFSLSMKSRPRVSTSRSMKAPAKPALEVNTHEYFATGTLREGRLTGAPWPRRGSRARRSPHGASRKP